jgi:hypothetical protein
MWEDQRLLRKTSGQLTTELRINPGIYRIQIRAMQIDVEVEVEGTQCPGVYPGHRVRGGYKYGDLALQVGGV